MELPLLRSADIAQDFWGLLLRSAEALLVIAECNSHRKARDAVIGQLLESHG